MDDRKRVPFTAVDHGRVDVDVRPSLECVAPERKPKHDEIVQ